MRPTELADALARLVIYSDLAKLDCDSTNGNPIESAEVAREVARCMAIVRRDGTPAQVAAFCSES